MRKERRFLTKHNNGVILKCVDYWESNLLFLNISSDSNNGLNFYFEIGILKYTFIVKFVNHKYFKEVEL